MRLVFWQNCLSPHQLPYIVRLMDDKRVDEVIIVAKISVSEERKKMGWNIVQYEGIDRCRIILSPNDEVIQLLLNARQQESWHFFSGIRADVFVFKCLQESLAYNIKRGVITERPNTYDFKRNIPNAKPYCLHRLRFFLQDRKYAKQIHIVFAMGQEAVAYFESLHVKWKVFPFCYCTQSTKFLEANVQAERLPQYAYCGSLSAWKDPLAITKGLSLLKIFVEVAIVGDGPMRPNLERYIYENHLNDKIHLLGTKPQSEVSQYMQQADVFILPSLYDGWGAVVNEALQAGCYVICSDAAGASDLIKNDARLGKVFHCGNIRQLADCMSWCSEHIDQIRGDRPYRIQWADEHISGKVVARYFVDCISGNYKKPLWA